MRWSVHLAVPWKHPEIFASQKHLQIETHTHWYGSGRDQAKLPTEVSMKVVVATIGCWQQILYTRGNLVTGVICRQQMMYFQRNLVSFSLIACWLTSMFMFMFMETQHLKILLWVCCLWSQGYNSESFLLWTQYHICYTQYSMDSKQVWNKMKPFCTSIDLLKRGSLTVHWALVTLGLKVKFSFPVSEHSCVGQCKSLNSTRKEKEGKLYRVEWIKGDARLSQLKYLWSPNSFHYKHMLLLTLWCGIFISAGFQLIMFTTVPLTNNTILINTASCAIDST